MWVHLFAVGVWTGGDQLVVIWGEVDWPLVAVRAAGAAAHAVPVEIGRAHV